MNFAGEAPKTFKSIDIQKENLNNYLQQSREFVDHRIWC
jgi:hypothetical protein